MNEILNLERRVETPTESLFAELDALYEAKHCFRHTLVPQETLKPILRSMYEEIQNHYSLDTLDFKKAYRQTVEMNPLEVPATVYRH